MPRFDDPYREIVRLQGRIEELRFSIFSAIAEMAAHPGETERALDLLSRPFVSKAVGKSGSRRSS